MPQKNSQNLVSIVTPVFNCEKLIAQTIACVQKQTHTEWELLLVDDCSTDRSAEIIKEFAKRDPRIRYIKLSTNSGAATARNRALSESKGKFIAYLDADDLWKTDKLERQIAFMLVNHYAFTCTNYEKIDENGKSLNKIVKLPAKIDYNTFLKNTIIQTVGVMVNTDLTGGKELLIMPNIRRRQDAATWCQLLKNDFDCYAIPETLSYYRVVKHSLSSNKLKAAKMNWHWYRKIEHLSLIKTCYCFTGYALHAIKKRVYLPKRSSHTKPHQRVLYIATMATKRERFDGETTKCNLLKEYLDSLNEIKLTSIDTDNWQKRALLLVRQVLFSLPKNDMLIISAANRGAHIILTFLHRIKSRKPLYYFVIGGSLAEDIEKHHWKIQSYQKATKIYVESKKLKNALEKYSLKNVEVINNFKKIQTFTSQYKKTKNIKFVFYGRVIKEKGIEEAIKLVKRLNAENIASTLDIYGQCKNEYLKKLQTTFDHNIRYHGTLKPDHKTEYETLSAYDIFILPTEYPGECLPGALIDAYIAGLAVIVSNWQYAKEYVTDNKNGKIFQYGNYDDMYQKTVKLIREDNIQEYKQQSKELAKKYDIKNVLQEFRHVLLESKKQRKA